MYNDNKRQFIFKQSSGVLWNFFYDDKLGLCYSTLNKRNIWTNPVPLHKNVHHSFFADMDSEDSFHLLFQDTKGNLYYSFINNSSIKTTIVLNSKTPAAYNKHLYLIPFKNSIYFFYVLNHEQSSIFAYQTFINGRISNPKVIDYVTNSICPYSILCDKVPNIYVFYQSSDGKYLQLGFKKFNTELKSWSEYTPATKYEGNCEYPKAIMDNNGIIHLSYQRQTIKQFEMVYQQKIPDKNLWTKEVTIHSSSHSFENASILWLNENIIIYWVRDDIIYYNIGNQSGNTWGKPSKFNFNAGRQLICMSYKTNNIYEAEKIALVNLPGSFVGGLRFAFYHHISDNGESLSVEELRTLIVDSLKLLKESVEELKETDSKIGDEITRLSNQQTQLEKEIVKCSVKIDMLENQINVIKTINTRLDKLENEMKRPENAVPPYFDT